MLDGLAFFETGGDVLVVVNRKHQESWQLRNLRYHNPTLRGVSFFLRSRSHGSHACCALLPLQSLVSR